MAKKVNTESPAVAYQVQESEKHLYHALLTPGGKRFNPKTGEEASYSYIQIFTKAEWRLFEQNAKNLGFEVEIIHNPIS